ncbi:hypothetical protein BBI17_001696 [Phytophthora kernoviae]|uniref:Uncharacterized protein n=2 Tax=Phytophthora kernoviae TaxID=325452 RepID=A0A421ESL0_9STRA|nr:hypothetical protein G195_006910 [Phytophthora kernoviae 00238/432]RLM96052.1 hypothetical protein BBI17_001696 [Phytophthora kernoviae]
MPPTQPEDLASPIDELRNENGLKGTTTEECLQQLSLMDAMMHKLGVMLLYIFPPPSSAAVYNLDKLQRSFVTLVEEDYPILIGELHIDPQTGVVSVKQTLESRKQGGCGIRFETNQSNPMTTESAAKSLSWELMPTTRGPTELICIKATPLSDGGLAIGLDTSHSLLDGEAVFTFMKVWGQHYNGVSEDERLKINHDRHLLWGTSSSSQREHPEFRVVSVEPVKDAGDNDKAETPPMPPLTEQHRFHFSPAMMKKIKEVASHIDSAAAGTVTPSRLDPPLPKNYAGNVIFSALSSHLNSELQPKSDSEGSVSPGTLGNVSRRIRASILESDSDYLRDAVNFLAEQSNLSVIQPSTNFFFGPDLMFTSWVHTGMYDAEFEGMWPRFVSIPPLPFDGFVVISEAPKHVDGVDVLVHLESTAMDKLKKLYAQVPYLHNSQMLLSTL